MSVTPSISISLMRGGGWALSMGRTPVRGLAGIRLCLLNIYIIYFIPPNGWVNAVDTLHLQYRDTHTSIASRTRRRVVFENKSWTFNRNSECCNCCIWINFLFKYKQTLVKWRDSRDSSMLCIRISVAILLILFHIWKTLMPKSSLTK